MTLVGEDTNQILADNANCDMIIYVDDFANAPKDMGRHHSNCVTSETPMMRERLLRKLWFLFK